MVTYLATVLFKSEIIRSVPIKSRSWRGVYVVDAFANIPLRQISEHGSFRKDHPEHGMNFLYAAFLTAAHGIAVVDTGTLYTVYTGFETLWIRKLTASVGQQDFKD